MNETVGPSQTLLLLAYLRKHPGLFLSISYVMLTMCGIFYSTRFYNQFDIPILKLANVSDLLIAGLSEPLALLMFCGGMLIAVSFDLMSQYSYNVQAKWQGQAKSIKRSFFKLLFYTPKKSEYVMLLVIVMFVLYANIFVSWFADWHSEKIKQGLGEKVVVSSEVVGSKPRAFALLGSTTHFLLVYSKDDEKAIVIPIDKLDKLTAFTAPAE